MLEGWLFYERLLPPSLAAFLLLSYQMDDALIQLKDVDVVYFLQLGFFHWGIQVKKARDSLVPLQKQQNPLCISGKAEE